MDPIAIFHEMNEGDEYPDWLRFIVLAVSSFVFQGTVYMDTSERLFKFGTDIVLSASIYSALSSVPSRKRRVVTAIVLAHSANYLLNGHLCAMLKKFDLISTSPATFDYWMQLLRRRTQSHPSIAGAAAYGSLSRGTLNSTSDLDVRVIRYSGLVHGVRACVFVARLRLLALVSQFPLDIYLLDSPDKLVDMRDDESPIVLANDAGIFSG